MILFNKRGQEKIIDNILDFKIKFLKIKKKSLGLSSCTQ